MSRSIAFVASLAILVAAWSSAARAAEPQDKDKPKDEPFPDLVAALKATPGCLGVETAQTASGKGVIFAWFENKKAAMNWYNSEVHVNLMRRFFPESTKSKKAMAHVPDDGGPIMAVASITMKGPPTKENPLPFKQISIELYQPLGGGLSIGGSFAPEKMKDHLPKEQPKK
jgi:hypothetical protein